MKKKFKLMNGLLLSSMVFSLSFGGIVQAEEKAPELPNLVSSQVSVNDARDKTEEIVLEKTEGTTLASNETEATTDITNTESDTTPQEEASPENMPPVENKPQENPPVDVENNDSEVDKSEEVTSPNEEVEETPGETEEPVEQPKEDPNIIEPKDPSVSEMDDKITKALKPIEDPEPIVEEAVENDNSYYESETVTETESVEENSDVSENTVSQDENTTSEKKPEESSKVKKSNLERLPETGIAENIEVIYIFEIIILGFALLLLSFKPKQKARVKK